MSSILDELHAALKKERKVSYWNSSKSELQVRCPYCGDSIKDKTHGHMYISNAAPYWFFCQRCESSGVLQGGTLEDLSVFDDELAGRVTREYRAFRRDTSVREGARSILSLKTAKFPKYDFKGSFKPKKQYLDDRLAINADRELLRKYKILNSLEDFVILNGMEHLLNDERFAKDCWLVDKYAIGWLSQDNSYASFRFIGGDFKKRFKTIGFDRFGEGSKIYTLRSRLELMAPDIEVVMTEGFFDLASVYNNYYREKDNLNRVFTAINGKGFNLFPATLMRMGFLNMNLTIYSDNDISLDDYRYILQEYRYKSIKIVYNKYEGQKDFGVRPELILPKTFKLK
jgi:ribosomal protein L24E